MCRCRALLGSCRISSQRASFKPSLGGGYPPPRWITAYFLLDLDVRLHREVLLDQAVGAAVLRRLRDTVHVGKRAVVDEVAGVGRVITIAHRYAVIRHRGRQRTCRNRHECRKSQRPHCYRRYGSPSCWWWSHASPWCWSWNWWSCRASPSLRRCESR